MSLQGNVSIKQIAISYTHNNQIYTTVSNSSGETNAGTIETNPRLPKTYRFTHNKGRDNVFDISFAVQNIFDLSSAEYSFTVYSACY